MQWPDIWIVNQLVFVADAYEWFECFRCPRQYQSLRSLRRHLKWECQQPPAFQCNLCPYRSKQRGNLKLHTTRRHV